MLGVGGVAACEQASMLSSNIPGGNVKASLFFEIEPRLAWDERFDCGFTPGDFNVYSLFFS